MKKYLNHASLGLPRCSKRVAGFFAFVGFLRHLRGLAAISSSASAFSSARNSRLARAILVAHAGLYRHQSRCRLCVEFNIYVVHRGHPYLKKMSARAARTAKLDTAIVALRAISRIVTSRR